MKVIIGSLLFFCAVANAQQPDSSLLKSPLKSFTDKEYSAFLVGEEMGMARVAELNGYPSPQGVDKFKKELSLNNSQLEQLKKIIEAWRFKAKEMGGFIMAEEAKLHKLFTSGKATDGAVIYYTNKIGLYLGELRNAHLQAHIKVKNMLTRDQIAKYMRLQGYPHR